MKILVVSPYLYSSKLNHGGAKVCFNRIKSLSALHDVVFLSFISEYDSSDESELSSFCSEIQTVQHRFTLFRRIKARVLSLLTFMPSGAYLWYSPDIGIKIEELLKKYKPDVVLFQYQQMAQYISHCSGVKAVIDIQDALSISQYRLFVSRKKYITRFIKFFDWLMWVKYESKYYRLFDKVITLTDQDRVGLQIFNPQIKACTIHVGMRISQLYSDKVPRNNTIAFFGYFKHTANVDAVIFFAKHILPLVVKSVPDVRFEIAGDCPPDEIISLESDRIKIKGYVDDLQKFLSDAKVVVIPLRYGGGIKIKTIEALANGCAIVSTSIGAEETHAVDGRDLYICDNPKDFAQKVISLLQNDDLIDKLRSNSRELAQKNFSVQAESRMLDKVITDIVKDKV